MKETSTTPRLDTGRATLGEALERLGAAVVPGAGAQWSLAPLDGGPVLVASLEGEWLTLTASLPLIALQNARKAPPWWLLRWNGILPGGPRLALTDADVLHLRVDVPLIDDAPGIGARLAEHVAVAGRAVIASVVCLTHDAARGEATDADVRAVETIASSPLGVVCAEAGWPFRERGDGTVAVELDVLDRFTRATLAANADGGVRARATLLRTERPADASRDAVATFLLRVADHTRMARPCVEPAANGDGACDVRLDAWWPSAPSAAELSVTLEALSVACRTVAREVDALCDESAAKAYLEMHGPAVRPRH